MCRSVTNMKKKYLKFEGLPGPWEKRGVPEKQQSVLAAAPCWEKKMIYTDREQ